MFYFFSQGKFQGLDLNEELYVGGYPNYTLLAKTAGIKTGFVGETPLCLRQRGVEVLMWKLIMIFLLCRLYPSAGHPRGRSDLQRPGPQLYGCHQLSHLQRPPVSGQSLQTHGYISNIRDTGGFIMSVSSMLSFRMEEPVRTQRPACTSAAAPEDSPAATASITHPCTVTQVPTVQSSKTGCDCLLGM